MANITKILIVVEGEETKFFKAFVEERFAHYKEKLSFEYITAGGRNLEMVKVKIQAYQASEGGKTLVIFDAENDIHSSRQSLNHQKSLVGDYEIFLLPNDIEHGNFESLLRKIAPNDNAGFFDCWDNYITCIEGLKNKVSMPNNKQCVYAYISLFLPEKEQDKAQTKNRDYTDARLWDLYHPALQPLYDFIEKHLSAL